MVLFFCKPTGNSVSKNCTDYFFSIFVPGLEGSYFHFPLLDRFIQTIHRWRKNHFFFLPLRRGGYIFIFLSFLCRFSEHQLPPSPPPVPPLPLLPHLHYHDYPATTQDQQRTTMNVLSPPCYAWLKDFFSETPFCFVFPCNASSSLRAQSSRSGTYNICPYDSVIIEHQGKNLKVFTLFTKASSLMDFIPRSRRRQTKQTHFFPSLEYALAPALDRILTWENVFVILLPKSCLFCDSCLPKKLGIIIYISSL